MPPSHRSSRHKHSSNNTHKTADTTPPTVYSARTLPSQVASTIPGHPDTLHSVSRTYDKDEDGNLFPISLEGSSGQRRFGIAQRGPRGLVRVDREVGGMSMSEAGGVVASHNARVRMARDGINDSHVS